MTFIEPLACSLLGHEAAVTIEPGSLAQSVMGAERTVDAIPRVRPHSPLDTWRAHGLRFSGHDEDGNVRIVDLPWPSLLPGHPSSRSSTGTAQRRPRSCGRWREPPWHTRPSGSSGNSARSTGPTRSADGVSPVTDGAVRQCRLLRWRHERSRPAAAPEQPHLAELAAFPFNFDLIRADHGEAVRLASGGPLEAVAGRHGRHVFRVRGRLRAVRGLRGSPAGIIGNSVDEALEVLVGLPGWHDYLGRAGRRRGEDPRGGRRDGGGDPGVPRIDDERTELRAGLGLPERSPVELIGLLHAALLRTEPDFLRTRRRAARTTSSTATPVPRCGRRSSRGAVPTSRCCARARRRGTRWPGTGCAGVGAARRPVRPARGRSAAAAASAEARGRGVDDRRTAARRRPGGPARLRGGTPRRRTRSVRRTSTPGADSAGCPSRAPIRPSCGAGRATWTTGSSVPTPPTSRCSPGPASPTNRVWSSSPAPR